ncbi:MAG: GNAT family N-acetyltransferase [Planctomycetes bacterium]|nr:GNAT family N-acetyltransferase [Planctomycetota bacterium]
MMAAEPRLRLIAVDGALFAALESAARFRGAYGAEIGEHAETARDIGRQSLDFMERAGATPPWLCYFTVDVAANAVVGCCGFKGNPAPGVGAEISYHTFPRYEGRGFATAMAREMVAIARAAGGVERAIAHTLPERNASCRVLEKAGFQCEGDVIEPEDGRVWRWSLALR